MTFDYGDGRSDQITGRAVACYDDQDPEQPADLTTFTVGPDHPSLTLMWLRTGARTPNDPTGAITDDAPDLYNVVPALDATGSCSGPGVDQGAVTGCSASYGG